MFQETVHCNEQLLVPDEGLEHVIFHEHRMALEWRRFKHMEELSAMKEMGTARHAIIAFENDWRVSAVTMISDSDIGSLLHGDARRPTYEVLITSPFKKQTFRDPVNEVSQKKLREIIHEIRTHDGQQYCPRPEVSAEAILNYCETYPADQPHDPDLHGSFEFREQHWYVPEFMRNRVMIPDDSWNHLVWESTRSGGREPDMINPYRMINQWCRENCSGAFAWTGAAVTWTFRDDNDALKFKLRWA